MKEELEQHYEAAGFSNVRNKELNEKTDDEIRNLYNQTFDNSDE